MKIELRGGPQDGLVVEIDSPVPSFLIVPVVWVGGKPTVFTPKSSLASFAVCHRLHIYGLRDDETSLPIYAHERIE